MLGAWTVPTLRNLACTGLIAGLLLAAPDAEARFGKRSDSSKSESKKSKTHEATAVGDEDSDGDRDDRPSRRSKRAPRHHRGGPSLLDIVFGFLAPPPPPPTYVVVESPGVRVKAPRPEPVAPTLRMGMEGGAMAEDGGTMADGSALVSLFLGIEGHRLGVATRYTGLLLPTDDGSVGENAINLFEAHLTVALWASPRARWRVEAGLSGATAPDVGFLGPSLATSLEACLGGPLDFEARLQAVPFPHRQVDAQVGLALHFKPFLLRGGWRTLVLDDAGHVGDERHVDVLTGPYLGVGLAF